MAGSAPLSGAAAARTFGFPSNASQDHVSRNTEITVVVVDVVVVVKA